MELRHQKVKENREKRLRELEEARKIEIAQKELRAQARDILQQEEKLKADSRRREEFLLQQEVVRVRRQMEEERRSRQAKESAQRSSSTAQSDATRESTARSTGPGPETAPHSVSSSELAGSNSSQQPPQPASAPNSSSACDPLQSPFTASDSNSFTADGASAERQREIVRRIELKQSERAKEALRVKQRCFTCWFNVVIERRLALSKARAFADFRLLRRAFIAWATFVRLVHVEREANRFQEQLRAETRKSAIAEKHYTQILLKKALKPWIEFVEDERSKRSTKLLEERKKTKMEQFLQSLTTKQSAIVAAPETNCPGDFPITPTDDQSTKGFTSDMENAATTCSTGNSPVSKETASPTVGSETSPRFAWQVSRKHVYAKLASASAAGAQGSSPPKVSAATAKQTSSGTGTAGAGGAGATGAPSVLSVARTFEARHHVQQRMLGEQLRLIREQQALIEQLKCEQTRALLSQEQSCHALQDTLLAQLERIQTRLEQIDAATKDPPDTSPASASTLSNCGAGPKATAKNSSASRPTRSNIPSPKAPAVPSGEDAAKQANVPVVVVDLGAAQFETMPSTENGEAPEPDSLESKQLQPRPNRVAVPREKRKATDLRTAEDIEFLKKMEEREAKRAQEKAVREERRRKLEAEKQEQRAREIEEQRKQEQEDRDCKTQELKERKRKEKEAELEKQKSAERSRELRERADAHYRVAQLKWRGLVPWLCFVELRRQMLLAAISQCELSLERRVLCAWRALARSTAGARAERLALADSHFARALMRRSFSAWHMLVTCSELFEQRATRYFEHRLLQSVFLQWIVNTGREKRRLKELEQVAVQHDLKLKKRQVFSAWQQLPALEREEREREKRRDTLRQKVASMLPDYVPPATIGAGASNQAQQQQSHPQQQTSSLSGLSLSGTIDKPD